MNKKKKPTISELLKEKRTRVALCEKNLYVFFAYYFSHYLFSESAPFHKDMAKDMEFKDVHTVLLFIAFRESAKTAWAKARFVHWIVYKKKRNLAWGGADNKKSEKNVMAIASELQENKKIINDFGQLYYEESGKSKKFKSKKKKSMAYFVAENDVFVQAFSPQVSPRGENYKEFRPDGYVLDDIENVKTAKSPKVTKTIREWLEEIFGGEGVDCETIILANKVSLRGNVAWLEEKAKDNPDFKVVYISAEEPDGSPTWKGKFKKTIAEAVKANKTIANRKSHYKSLEKIKRKLGTALYNQEMLNQPRQDGDALIKQVWIKHFDKSRLKRGKQSGAIYYHFPGHEKATKLTIMTGIDPAVSQKESADERVIAVVGRGIEREADKENGLLAEVYYFVLRIYAGRWSLDGFARELKKAKEAFPPAKIGCESNGVQDVFRQVFQKYGLSTYAINPKGDKLMRMSEHESDFEFGYVLFPGDGSERDTIDEVLDFTGEDGKPDNRVDAIEIAMRMHKQSSGVYVSSV